MIKKIYCKDIMKGILITIVCLIIFIIISFIYIKIAAKQLPDDFSKLKIGMDIKVISNNNFNIQLHEKDVDGTWYYSKQIKKNLFIEYMWEAHIYVDSMGKIEKLFFHKGNNISGLFD